MMKRILLIVLLTAILSAAGCSEAATSSGENESTPESQTVDAETKAQPEKSEPDTSNFESETDTHTEERKTDTPNETDTQTSTAAPSVTEESEIGIAAPYSDEYEHMPLREKPYQAPDVSDVSKYFVHKKVGSGQDMDLYLELLDKETDGLYCTVKNNKNVWRVVRLSVCDPDEKFDNYISSFETFALAPNQEVVVKLDLDAKEYTYIKSLDLVFFCNGLNYSADEQTADINEKEPDLVLNYFLYVRYSHIAVPWNVEGEPDIDLTEDFIRGFATSFVTSESENESA